MSKSIVYVPGVWDLLHVGHINFLRRASRLGDVLVVGVQSDEFVMEQKKHAPVICTKDRIAALESLKFVDIALPYDDYNYIEHFRRISGDVFVLSEEHCGADRFKELIAYLKDDCKKVAYLPYDKSISTTGIKQKMNVWGNIWEKVANSNKSDYEIVGHDAEKTKKLAHYFTKSLGILPEHKVLDYGCGTGTIIANIDCQRFGIDISKTMIVRALLNCPKAIYLESNTIPFLGSFDHIISWGTLHYLQNHAQAIDVLDKMIALSESIMILEIPDIDKRNDRLINRKKMGKILYPEPLYFEKEMFVKKGFRILRDDPKLTDNSQYSFGVHYVPIR